MILWGPFQRVNAECITERFHSLHDAIIKLNAFIQLFTDVTQTALQRANLALDNILEFVIEKDFEFMYQKFASYLDVYATHYEDTVDKIQIVIDADVA